MELNHSTNSTVVTVIATTSQHARSSLIARWSSFLRNFYFQLEIPFYTKVWPKIHFSLPRLKCALPRQPAFPLVIVHRLACQEHDRFRAAGFELLKIERKISKSSSA